MFSSSAEATLSLLKDYLFETYLKQVADCYAVFNHDPYRVVAYSVAAVVLYRSLFAFFFPRLYNVFAWLEMLVVNVMYAMCIILTLGVTKRCDL